jgi:hypothetical protein
VFLLNVLSVSTNTGVLRMFFVNALFWGKKKDTKLFPTSLKITFCGRGGSFDHIHATDLPALLL